MPDDSTLASALVGAWRLESTVQRFADGTVRPSPLYGPHGVGYLIYSPSGQMCAILADPHRELWASPDEPSQDELQSIHDHFIAYCGSYEVQEQAGIVLHHIELHITPNNNGAIAARRVSVNGSRLTLMPLDDELPTGMLEYTLTWVRFDAIELNSINV
ncbi:MAG TPA: lipocalin-like domain-containing protein [Anaerolineae bacterium]|nr:lipocalin-like domain-containing protein [Anaerolineae bacterium]